MRALIQRVAYGMVSVASRKIGEIGKGYVVFLGIQKGDTEDGARRLARKILMLKLFSEDRRMKKTIIEEGGALLIVPEITLYARTEKGRLDFTDAEQPERAKKLFELFGKELEKSGLQIESGIFGAHMLVEIYNDGPVTIMEEI